MNVIGKTFGRLTIICASGKKTKSGHKFFRTQCTCGNSYVANGNSLQQGDTKSCGCLRKEKAKKNAELAHLANIKHGMSKNRIYTTWHDMRQRCKNPKDKGYKRYGGRGISVCREWGDFISFKEWAYANGYRDDLTIDRIDNDGNYEPANCQWLINEENIQKAQEERSKRILSKKAEVK